MHVAVERHRVVGIERDGRRRGFGALRDASRLPEGHREVAVQLRVLRRQRRRAPETVRRLRPCTAVGRHHAEVAPRLNIVRVRRRGEPQRLVRLGAPSREVKRRSEFLEPFRVRRVQPHRFAIGRRGAFMIAKFGVLCAEFRVSARVFRVRGGLCAAQFQIGEPLLSHALCRPQQRVVMNRHVCTHDFEAIVHK